MTSDLPSRRRAVDAERILAPRCRLNFAPLGYQSEEVINVEHWAEIRRLHLSEQLGVKGLL